MKVNEIAVLIKDRIESSVLDKHNYISTENMLNNCGGIVDSSSIPDGKVTRFLTNDILLSNIRPYFKKVWFASFNGGCSNDVICIRTNTGCSLPKYLYYALCTDHFIDTFSASSKGTKMPRGDKNALLDYSIPNISIEKQQHIVDILGSIDESIENNTKIASELESFATQKYASFTCNSVVKIRLETIIEIYDFKRIPLSSRERETRQGKYPYYGATGVLDHVDDYLFSGEYVLIAEDGTVIDADGHPIVQLINDKFWVNNHAHILQATNGYSNYSLYIALKNLQVAEAITGAVQLKINQANMCALELPRLEENELLKLNLVLEPVFKQILHLRTTNEKLTELKNLYLKKFFG